MKIAGEATLVAPVEQVWDALLDPQVLVSTIPGCSRLEQSGENSYDMTVTAGVAAVRGTYTGTCRLSDLRPHESLRMSLQGAGAPGTIDADVDVRFDSNGDGTTTLSYEADAVVGGMVGGVGQRMLTSVSRRMAGEFFTNVEQAIRGVAAHEEPVPAAPAAAGAGIQAPAAGQVFTAPPRGGAGVDQDSFLKGIAVGAGLVALGVVLGGVLGRRR
jgi:uncharacterized protein